ncbi:transposase [Nitrobacter winogradskyi]|uniref:Transposase n=1 Tax=Nitrobacter winogradskyi TaxID=913 RepID=A0ACC6ANW6_NITWI|nr:transposase [Nitrobacter winogradskyi]
MPNRVAALRFNRRLYRKRNLIERFFSKIKHYRAVATRYDKRDDNFIASIKLALIRICLRFIESMT